MVLRIYLSFCAEDHTIALDILRDLHNRSFVEAHTWEDFPKLEVYSHIDILAGSNPVTERQRFLRTCHYMVVLQSPLASLDPDVRAEITSFAELGRQHIIPVKLGHVSNFHPAVDRRHPIVSIEAPHEQLMLELIWAIRHIYEQERLNTTPNLGPSVTPPVHRLPNDVQLDYQPPSNPKLFSPILHRNGKKKKSPSQRVHAPLAPEMPPPETWLVAPNGDTLKVFISYSQNEKQLVDDLVEKVRGFCSVWLDAFIGAGENRQQRILEEITRADIFVLLLSKSSNESFYCQHELAEALRLKRPVLPIRMSGDVQPPPSITHLEILELHNLRTNHHNMGKLKAALRNLAEKIPAQVDVPIPPPPEISDESRSRKPYWWIAAVFGIVMFVTLIYTILLQPDPTGSQTRKPDQSLTPATEITEVAKLVTTPPAVVVVPTATDTLTSTLVPTATPMPTSTTTVTPTATSTITASPTSTASATSLPPIATPTVPPTGTFGTGGAFGPPLVTNAEYQQCADPNEPGKACDPPQHQELLLENEAAPVVSVTWQSAMYYCDRHDMRLPLESEWHAWFEHGLLQLPAGFREWVIPNHMPIETWWNVTANALMPALPVPPDNTEPEFLPANFAGMEGIHIVFRCVPY